MKKRNWVIMMSAAALAMASVTGCSSQNGGKTTAKVENAGGSKDGASADGVKEITMWYQENKTMIPAFDQRVEDFNKKYEGKYHLTIEYIPRGSSYAYEDKVNSAAAAGILPDLLSLDGPNVSNYAANGIIVPITSYVSEDSKNDMLPSTVLQNTYKNDMYAVSFNEAVSLFYYNKDVFEEHGFRIPEGIDDAYTLDEVYEMAKEVSTPEMVGIKIIMDKGEGMIYGLSPLFDSAGAPLVSEDGSKADGYINSEKSVETAAKLQKFFDEKLANIDPTPTEFQDQKAAMWIAGNTNQMVQFEQFPDLHWGATYLPKTGDHVVSNCGSWTLGISKDCKDPDAAYVALEFMTNSESTRLYGEVGGYPPARKSAYENNTQWDEYPYSLAKEQLFEAAVPRPKTPVYTVLTSKFAEAMLDIFTGSDAKESLDAVASYVDDEYARVQDSMK